MREVYCLECGAYVLREDAGMVFKTGFFKSGPLGVCKCCVNQGYLQFRKPG
jgi:hypothetical protein